MTARGLRCRASFPLYNEARKLFNHSEGMVRAAVRMLTINVYSVGDPSMLDYVASAPCSHYFHEVALHLADHALHFDRHLDALQSGVTPHTAALRAAGAISRAAAACMAVAVPQAASRKRIRELRCSCCVVCCAHLTGCACSRTTAVLCAVTPSVYNAPGGHLVVRSGTAAVGGTGSCSLWAQRHAACRPSPLSPGGRVWVAAVGFPTARHRRLRRACVTCMRLLQGGRLC